MIRGGVHRGSVSRSVPRATAAIALAVAACSGDEGGAVELRFQGGEMPRTWVASYEQDLEWGSAAIQRRFGARYTLIGTGAASGAAPSPDAAASSEAAASPDAAASPEAAGATPGPAGPDVRLRLHLDSLAIVVTLPHGRQAFDTRHLVGDEVDLSVAPRGGRPEWPDGIPTLEIGMMEGRVSLDRLVDVGFPELPGDPVAVGDRWTGRATRPDVEANVEATADVTTEYELAAWETAGGIRVARIVGRLAGQITASDPDAGTAFAGSLEGTLTWHFDPDAGALVDMSGETTSDGVLTVSGNESTVRQRTRVRIDAEGA